MNKIDLTERIGVHKVALIFLEDFGWIEREQTITDIGIDMQVEIVEDNIPTGQLVALQIKTGASYFDEQKDGNFIFRGEKKHLEYWTNYSLPVIIILHNPVTNKTYWQRVKPSLITETAKRWKIGIPDTQLLSVEHKLEITKFYQNSNHFTIVELSDTSHGTNRRVAAKILVENTHAQSRVTMRNIIPELNEKLKRSDYHRSEITKTKYKDMPAEVISIFFYNGIMQVNHGLPFCRTVWAEEQCKASLMPFEADETVDQIGIKWDVENEAFNESIKGNQLSKGAYLEITDRLYNELTFIASDVKNSLVILENNNDFILFKNNVLTWKDSIEIMDQQVSNLGHPPVECQDIDSIIQSNIVYMHNIIVVITDQSRDQNNISYVINSYMKKIQQDLPFYKYERKKVT